MLNWWYSEMLRNKITEFKRNKIKLMYIVNIFIDYKFKLVCIKISKKYISFGVFLKV